MKINQYLLAVGATSLLTLAACSDDKINIDYPVHVLELEEGHAGYELVWADEFDTNGLPNAANWDYEEGYRRNDELQDYKKADETTACVKDGKLVLTAYPNPHDGINPWTQEPYHFEFNSASVITKNKVGFERGRIDILARIPRGQGVWPAFWLRPSTNRYPNAYSEIDIMEYVWDWDDAHSRIHATFHTQEGLDGIITRPSGTMSCNSLDTKFHLYSLVWGYRNIKVLFDNKVVASFDRTGGSAKHWPFDQPHFLLMNIAVGGEWGGQWGIDTDAFPLSMEIDYVRYYKLIEEESKPFYPVSNYIENGDFETDYKEGEAPILVSRANAEGSKLTGFLNRWIACDDSRVDGRTLSIDPTTGADGSSKSLTYKADKLPSWYMTDITFPFEGIKPGSYTLSFYAKSNKEASSFVVNLGICETEAEIENSYKEWKAVYVKDGVTEIKAKTSGGDMYATMCESIGTEWQKYSVTVDIPENVLMKIVLKPHTKVGSIGANNYGIAPGGNTDIQFWFDQFEFSEAQD